MKEYIIMLSAEDNDCILYRICVSKIEIYFYKLSQIGNFIQDLKTLKYYK